MSPTMHLKVEPIYLPIGKKSVWDDGSIHTEGVLSGYRVLQWWSNPLHSEDGDPTKNIAGEWRYLEGTTPPDKSAPR